MRSTLVFLSLCLATTALADDRAVSVARDQSRITIKVSPNVDKFTASVSNFKLQLSADGTEDRVNSVRLSFRFDAIRTGKPDRDKAMNEWENATVFPNVEYALTKLAHRDGTAYTAEGLVTLHGVQKLVSFPVTIAMNGPTMIVDGESTIDTREFGLPVIRKFMVLTVDPHLTVIFHIEGTLGPRR